MMAVPVRRPRLRPVSPLLIALGVVVALVVGQIAVAPPPAEAAARPKAVIIVGPAGSSTARFLDTGDVMAKQAEAAGMSVTRIFHPRATWQRVLANIGDANLVAYMGHGNGWPSPYAPFQEKTKNGFGLNPTEGASASKVTYYGANYIRQHIKLAPNAVVALVHLCYAAGNGEPGMSTPSWDVARQRVDNFAAGFLAAGARAVFAFGWRQKWDLPKALASSNKTMDQIFQTPNSGYPSGWIGWNPKYFSSERTKGARLHLDPHRTSGFYRAVTGDLKMTAGEWRGGKADSDGGSSDSSGGSTSTSTDAPSITELSVQGTEGSATSASTGSVALSSALPMFHPNGDGLADRLVVAHTLTKAAYLDVRITNSAGKSVRKFTVWAAKGSSTSKWNGKNGSGSYVADGTYTLTYRPRDTAGNVGKARSVGVLVLATTRALAPSPTAIYSVNRDGLAQKTSVTIKLNKTATITWRIVNAAGETVRTVRNGVKMSAGTYILSWNGKDGAGNYVPDGWYRSVVSTKTSLGTYTTERSIYAGAFRIASSVSSPKRGQKVTFTITSTEPLKAAPRLEIKQPGLSAYTVSTTHVAGRRYQVTVTLKSGGNSGTLRLTAHGTNTAGSKVSTTERLPLR